MGVTLTAPNQVGIRVNMDESHPYPSTMSYSCTIQAPEHTIKSVTVFKSSKAEVVRTFTLDLKKGQNKIEIRALPSTIDTHSVRVSGLGEARLFGVVCTIANNRAASYIPGSTNELIRVLNLKKTAFDREISVREQESELLLAYAKTLSGEHVSPTQMGQFLESYVEQEHYRSSGKDGRH
ncbi:hypothetical protein B0H34DRAFT_731171 [Crassisporium funariophilum]|nr:hypothetical protein B0H34DRAFT_731171 [Crassisporium funariophilum]